MSTAASVSALVPASGDAVAAPDWEAILSRARREYSERPDAVQLEAMRCYEVARSAGELSQAARALAIQGAVSVHRGDLVSGVALALEAADTAEHCGHAGAQAEVTGLRAVLSFFAGAYSEAVLHAMAAIDLADADGDPARRLDVRRLVCPVFANLAVDDLQAQLTLILQLSAGDAREEALSHNDLATLANERGDRAHAEREIAAAFARIEQRPDARFARAALHVTRAEIRLTVDSNAALDDARRAIELLSLESSPNPYVLAAAVRSQVACLVALGDVEEAQRIGVSTLASLGERLPQTRSAILTMLADALHGAGRTEEAYDTLARAAELEREAFRELAELKLGLERATLEAREARRYSDSLLARNRQLAIAHAELERRSRELERLQDQLRDQAERDWLTGLHNRRFLARRLEGLERGEASGPISAALLDIDHFKAINDRFGHDVGDQVLVRVARVLGSLLRRGDAVIRSGGEEFLLLLEDTDAETAAQRCERIRQRIAVQPWEEFAPDLHVTASIGVGSTDDPTHIRDILADGDVRLYAAKRAGRNRVITG